MSWKTRVTIRHHALESGCFVVNATGWLTDEQIAQVTPDAKLQKALHGGNCTAIVSPEGVVLSRAGDGEGMAVADLDFSLITKRKRMMDSVGHYARPELLKLCIDTAEKSPIEYASPESSIGTLDSQEDLAASPVG